MCFFETGPSPLNQVCFSVSVCVRVALCCVSHFFFFSFGPFVAESASVGQHREAGKVITEAGSRLPDSGGNRYVACLGLGLEKKKGGVLVCVGGRHQVGGAAVDSGGGWGQGREVEDE